ncbi:hypothetical protein DFQ28_000808 [Apophysomyces sp. BC1034]|nr:hypothetical protein DFQ30_000790 [Apophysomyces sp. BC1015]KAG0177575.1 hypothetical protein DFQ29_004673 [Apophysomyces sp. BC1021]KAG0191154.1 hypothetical protein DFQ28_000808 [Apophysomyces sp. BC1034]
MAFADRFIDSVARFWDKHQDATKLTLTAVAASALTASSILSYQAAQRQRRARDLKHQLSSTHSSQTNLTSFGTIQHGINTYDESLIEEQLARNVAFLGDKGVKKLRRSFVIVVGAGGVGSWAALMLLRSGVQRIRVIDFDQVTLSSLNRHAVATLDDVGTPKVTAITKHFKQIAPFCDIDSRIELFNAETAEELLSGDPDYVVDAIDNIDTKLDLIKYCYDHKLEVISSMGAGAKADPSRIQIADISETFEDPLARAVRRKLKKMNIDRGVPVAYSTEKPHHVKLLPLEDDHVQEADDFAALPDFRARILPVLGTIPSMFGMAIATFIILKLAEFPAFEPLPIKLRDGLYQRMHRDLMAREGKHYKNKICPLDSRDVAYIFEEMWHGKSVVSGPQDRLALVRWDRSKPLSYFNTVCLSKSEAAVHEKLPVDADLRLQYGDDIFNFVTKRFEEEMRLRKLWEEVL